MKVRELLVKLNKWPLDAEIILDNADTGWEFPTIHVGYGQYGQQRDIKTGELDQKVHIWIDYTEKDK